jgi:hypothetical protein
MIVECPACKARTNVPAGKAGKRFRCRKCSWVIQIPNPEAATKTEGEQAPRSNATVWIVVGVLALAGLAVGLFFLIRSLSGTN